MPSGCRVYLSTRTATTLTSAISTTDVVGPFRATDMRGGYWRILPVQAPRLFRTARRQIPLRIQRRCAALPRRGDRLPIHVIRDIARCENAGHVGVRAIFLKQIAV